MSRAAWPEPDRPILVLITDRRLVAGGALVGTVAAAVAGGVDLVQLREKDLPAAELLRLTLELRGVIGSTPIVVNDRLDVALAADAAGVHLPETGLPVGAARTVAPGRLIGASVHDVATAHRARAAGADYAQFGTVFPSQSKPGRAAAGLDELATVCRATAGPVIAVGGIDAGNAGAAITAGAAGVAVISAVMAAADPRGAARALRAAIEAAWATRQLAPTARGSGRLGAGISRPTQREIP